MHRARQIGHSAAVVYALLCCLAVSAFGSTKKDVDAVNAVIDAVEKGFATRDADALMSNYVKEPGALVVFDLSPPARDIGYEQNLAKLKTFFSGLSGPAVFKWHDRRVQVDGRHAYVTALLSFTGTTINGAKLENEARSTLVLQRIDGKWLIVHEHDSLPADFRIPGYGENAPSHGSSTENAN